MTMQRSNNNNLNYLIDTLFTKVTRLFVLSLQRIEENNVKKDHRDYFSRYYVPNIEIKKFNVLIDGKSFFDLPVKSEEEIYEKIIEMSRNYDHTTANLFDFAYFSNSTETIDRTNWSGQAKFRLNEISKTENHFNQGIRE